MRTLLFSLAAAALAVAALPAKAEKTLSADELKALISGKTVYTTSIKKGVSWQAYHAADGTLIDSRGEQSTWYVSESGEHCNESPKVKMKCATIIDNGDGTYDRVAPSGKHLVKWTQFVDGQDF